MCCAALYQCLHYGECKIFVIFVIFASNLCQMSFCSRVVNVFDLFIFAANLLYHVLECMHMLYALIMSAVDGVFLRMVCVVPVVVLGHADQRPLWLIPLFFSYEASWLFQHVILVNQLTPLCACASLCVCVCVCVWNRRPQRQGWLYVDHRADWWPCERVRSPPLHSWSGVSADWTQGCDWSRICLPPPWHQRRMHLLLCHSERSGLILPTIFIY